jgi:glutathione S-transferase kappa 1
MTRITLYYDCVSPYSWLAFEFLLSKAKSWNFELILKPIFLGAVMKSSGNLPPAFVPWKGQYMIKDL